MSGRGPPMCVSLFGGAAVLPVGHLTGAPELERLQRRGALFPWPLQDWRFERGVS